MNELQESVKLHVVPLSARAHDRWRLSDRYVEEVWSEHLGPTATLLARRLGRVIAEHPEGIEIDLGELSAGLGVQPSIAVKGLARLDRFEVLHFALERRLVGVSGFVPSATGARLLRLSQQGRLVHDRLVAASVFGGLERPALAACAGSGRVRDRDSSPARGQSL